MAESEDVTRQKLSSFSPPFLTPEDTTDPSEEIADEPTPVSKIVTTEDELEAYYIIRGMLQK